LLLCCLLGASCTCGKPFEPLDGGVDDGGPQGDGGNTGGGGGFDAGTVAATIVPVRGATTSIAVDPLERPQILTRFQAPILASWTGTAWDVQTLFDPDAGNGLQYLVDDLTLSIDRTGLRHMSWTLETGYIEYALWDGSTLQRFNVFTPGVQWFGAVPVSPRTHDTFPVVAYIQEGDALIPGTHFGRQLDDGGFTDVSVACCITRNVALAARTDGGIAVAWEDFSVDAMQYAEEQPDGGFTPEPFAPLSEGQLSMAFGLDGVPQLLFQHNGGVAWATRDGGGWSIEDVEPSPAGDFTSLALAPDDSPRAVFTARDGGLLVHAVRSAQGWTVAPIAPEAFFPSIAVDSHGASHVSYLVPEDGGVRYVKVP
jgi:hypothetical protein